MSLVVSYIVLEYSHGLCHVECRMSRVKAPQVAGVLTGGFGGDFRDNFREFCVCVGGGGRMNKDLPNSNV